MNYDNKKTAGLLLFVGTVQFVLAIIISEAVYSGYSVRQQQMSDLGDWSLAGNSAAIWNISGILWGLFIIAGAYFIQRGFKSRLFPSLLVIIGFGWTGLSVVSLDISLPVHILFAWVAGFSALASVFMCYKFVKSPLSYVSVILGAVMVAGFVLFGSGSYLGLGLGGMQRILIYPLLLWLLGFGAYLIGDSSDTK